MGSRGSSLVLLCLSCLLIPACSVTNTLEQGKKLRYGELLNSSNDLFKLGFFRFDSRADISFLGIWYNNRRYWRQDEGNGPIVSDPVWIANRNNPIFNRSGILSVNGNRNGCLSLQILSGEREIVALYSTRDSIQAHAILKDDGNFVLRQLNSEGSVEGDLWQSFDHPTDTLLPGMKLGFNLKTGLNWTLTSPSTGSFTLGVDPNGTKELVMLWRDDVYWRSGLWQVNNSVFPNLALQDDGYSFSFTQNENETYFNFSANREIVNSPSIGIRNGWVQVSILGGLFSVFYCHSYEDDGGLYQGCIKQKLPECRGTMFDHDYISSDYGSMSSAGFRFSDSENLTLEDCNSKCLLNCSCFAYAATNDQDNTGCEIWVSRAFFRETYHGRMIYMLPSKGNKWWLWLTIVVGGMMIVPTLFSICYIIWKKCTSNGDDENINQRTLIKELEGRDAPSIPFGKIKGHKKDRNELHVFSFESIVSATNYFSTANKLGEGGFGPVYKGILFDGREVAIKRLSRSSGQGVAEFKNEALLIAKLQHMNLVRLLGFCIQGDENILVYEYMPNKSLDSFLFDPVKKKVLNWKIRLNIIEGIAQGLLYLHKYSRLRVIHRDLKASNILLDDEMNPKISDFGMARIFGLDEYEANTNRVVGTYGYMSPEYVFHGLVSVKTDVFSFGVLLLELVSGMKNTGRYHSEHPLNLSGYIWQLWNEDKALGVMDPTLDGFFPRSQILRCIHIGLLCVQDHAIDRPTMHDVVSMLSNETMPLPQPKQPAFFITTTVQEGAGGPETKLENCSINQVSISVMEAR